MSETTGVAPKLYGYIREHLFMSANERADLLNEMTKLAAREGYELGKVFAEKVETVPQAFEALVAAVVDDKVSAVVVPNLHHFAPLGFPITMRDLFEKSTGAKVLVFDPGP